MCDAKFCIHRFWIMTFARVCGFGLLGAAIGDTYKMPYHIAPLAGFAVGAGLSVYAYFLERDHV